MEMKKMEVKCSAIDEKVTILMFRSKTGKIQFKILCNMYRGNNKCGSLYRNVCPFMISLKEGGPLSDALEEEKEKLELTIKRRLDEERRKIKEEVEKKAL